MMLMTAARAAANQSVHGRAILSTVRTLKLRHQFTLFNRGFASVSPDEWYDLEDWVACLQVAEARGTDLHHLGYIAAMSFPQNMMHCTPDTIVDRMNRLYHDLHFSHSLAPAFVQIRRSDTTMRLLAETPYPPQYLSGIIAGIFAQLPTVNNLSMSYSASKPPRHGKSPRLLRFDISWEKQINDQGAQS